jgi:integrase
MAFIFRAPHCKYFIAGFTDASGKRRNRSTRLTDRKKAQKQADDWEAAWRGKLSAKQFERVLLEGVENVSGETKLARSFDAYLAEWFAAKKLELASSSVYRLEAVLERFKKHLGTKAGRPIREISQADIASFRNIEASRISAGSVNLEIKFIRMLFRSAKSDGVIAENPAENVKTIRREADKKGRRPFTVEEMKAILDTCDPEWRSMILFALYTGGQRLSDVASLTWSNVDIARKEIRFETRKTGRRIILPLVGPLLRHVEALPTSDDLSAPIHPRAFETFRKQGRSATLSNQFDDILAKAGLKAVKTHARKKHGRDRKREGSSIGFHALRMTATTLMHDAGIPAATVQAIVGHESEDVHRVYVKIGRESQERALNALPLIL